MKPNFGEWQPPEMAPKTGTVILADFGYPWPHVAAWNKHDERWCIASLAAQAMQSGNTDVWFENEQESPEALKAWMPLPEKNR